MGKEMELFDKVITFTDIHFGLKNNNIRHNYDCINFIEFMIETAKQRGIKKCIFIGDYFDNRSYININTLDFGIAGISMLNDYFDDVWFLVGNHDMYYRNKRLITSVKIVQQFENIHYIDEITQIGDVTFIPFLTDEEINTLSGINTKYVFGHLELAGYKLNKLTTMEEGDNILNDDAFNQCEYVFSGHYHKRQEKILPSGTHVVYTGNCFPHNFGDSFDDERGVMILEHNGTPEFINYPDAPTYRDVKLSQLLSNPMEFCSTGLTHLKVYVDFQINLEEFSFIRDIINAYFEPRTFKVEYSSAFNDLNDSSLTRDDVMNKSVSDVVVEQINAMETVVLDKNILIKIFNELKGEVDA